MSYQVTTTTTASETHARSFATLDAVEQFLEPVQWKGDGGRLVVVSDEPLVAVYAASIQSFAFAGFTLADVQKREVERQAEYQRQAMTQKAIADQYAGIGNATTLGGINQSRVLR